MKNSREYSKQLQKFFRSVKRGHLKVKKVTYDDVTESVVHGIILEDMSESAVKSAFKKFDNYFVDFNDLRVSRPEEIVEMLGEDSPATRQTASRIGKVLGAVFRKYNDVNLEVTKKMGKRPAKKFLEKLDGNSRFVVDYCMLTALQGHAIPLTNKMVEYLKSNELVHPEADEQEIEGFLTRQISARSAYEFYSLLRREIETSKKTEEKKTTRKKKTTTRAKTKKKK